MNEEDKDPIGKALNVSPFETTRNAVELLKAKAHDDSAKNDFEMARTNIHEAITTGQEALFKLSEIASSSQHPRAFEVLAKLMDSIVGASKDLLVLQTKIREIDSSDTPINEKAQTINNNLFVGSTAELQKVLKDLKKKDD
jgi:hypothetical protein